MEWRGKYKFTEVRLVELSDNQTKVIRRSPFSGLLAEKDYDISFDKFLSYYNGNGGLIQQAFPELSADDREFIMTGITPRQWDTLPKE